MGSTPNQVLFVVSVISILALGIGFVCMPSDEDKLKKMNQKYFNQKQSYRPEVLQKMKEQEKSGQQFMNTIRSAAKSDQIIFGQKKDKND